METKLGGMKIKHTLEVGSPIVIIEAPPMLKTTEPMSIMQPNTGRLKPSISENLFIGKKISEKKLPISMSVVFVSLQKKHYRVSIVQIYLPRHNVVSCTNKIPKKQFCFNQDLWIIHRRPKDVWAMRYVYVFLSISHNNNNK
jgi:hypothetical protein